MSYEDLESGKRSSSFRSRSLKDIGASLQKSLSQTSLSLSQKAGLSIAPQPPKDVDEAIGEIGRVASRFLVLKIAARHDSTPTYKTMDKETRSQLPGDLHPVVQKMPWWHAKFAKVGFKLHRTIPSRHWWTCCSFVMERVSD